MESIERLLGLAPEHLGSLPLAELEARARRARNGSGLLLRDWAAVVEAWRIAQALEETRGNRAAAARLLGIGRRTLYTKLERLGFPTDRGAGTPPPRQAPGPSPWGRTEPRARSL